MVCCPSTLAVAGYASLRDDPRLARGGVGAGPEGKAGPPAEEPFHLKRDVRGTFGGRGADWEQHLGISIRGPATAVWFVLRLEAPNESFWTPSDTLVQPTVAAWFGRRDGNTRTLRNGLNCFHLSQMLHGRYRSGS